jgi:tRNA (cmo5U34)-methyltransferase
MDRTQLEATFDQQAGLYDEQWARLAPFRDGLHLLAASAFAALPDTARVLCVGAGTGAEIHFFARRFPRWEFVAVEPSAGMVRAAKARAESNGYAGRCHFHAGYLESLPAGAPFDAATSLLVSQFLLDPGQRTGFFRAIADRLTPHGMLVSSDLAADTGAASYPGLLELWCRTMSGAALSPERLGKMRAAYETDVAILPPARVEAIIAAGGFAPPLPIYQAGLIHAWACRREEAEAGGPAGGDA